jgi:hypothetical protein
MRPLRRWHERAPDEAALFNPAFLAAVINRAASGYHRETGNPLPFALAFLVAPIVLVRPTREALPGQIRTSMAAWLQEQPRHRLHFPRRAGGFVPYVREGVLYGTACGGLEMAEDGALGAHALVRGSSRRIREATREYGDVMKKAEFVGRWFGKSGTPDTIMSLWGVRP